MAEEDEEFSDIDSRDLAGNETKKEEKGPDYFVRQQRNRVTETLYLIYDVRLGSEMFQPLPDGTSYVTAIAETGEWEPHRTRNDATQSLYPYAKWSESEMTLMSVKATIDRLTLAASMCIEGFIPQERLAEVAEMLITEGEMRKAEVLPDSLNEKQVDEEE
jgi:hypothetical protein